MFPTGGHRPDDLSEKTDALDFGVEKSLRYHQRMRGHYDALHRSMMFLVLVGGSAAFAGVVEWAHYFSAAVALIAAVELVWGISHRARDHEILHKRFSDLAVSIRTTLPSGEAYRGWLARRIEIESDEPPIHWALEADYDNEVRLARGRSDLARIGWWPRLTMYYQRHTKHTFPNVG